MFQNQAPSVMAPVFPPSAMQMQIQMQRQEQLRKLSQHPQIVHAAAGLAMPTQISKFQTSLRALQAVSQAMPPSVVLTIDLTLPESTGHNCLGKGTYGCVYPHKTKHNHCVKVSNDKKDPHGLAPCDLIFREAIVMGMASHLPPDIHRHFPRIYSLCYAKEHLFMEMASYIPLNDVNWMKYPIHQLVSDIAGKALPAMHNDMKLVHGDVSWSNIMFSVIDEAFVLIDFSLCKTALPEADCQSSAFGRPSTGRSATSNILFYNTIARPPCLTNLVARQNPTWEACPVTPATDYYAFFVSIFYTLLPDLSRPVLDISDENGPKSEFAIINLLDRLRAAPNWSLTLVPENAIAKPNRSGKITQCVLNGLNTYVVPELDAFVCKTKPPIIQTPSSKRPLDSATFADEPRPPVIHDINVEVMQFDNVMCWMLNTICNYTMNHNKHGYPCPRSQEEPNVALVAWRRSVVLFCTALTDETTRDKFTDNRLWPALASASIILSSQLLINCIQLEESSILVQTANINPHTLRAVMVQLIPLIVNNRMRYKFVQSPHITTSTEGLQAVFEAMPDVNPNQRHSSNAGQKFLRIQCAKCGVSYAAGTWEEDRHTRLELFYRKAMWSLFQGMLQCR